VSAAHTERGEPVAELCREHVGGQDGEEIREQLMDEKHTVLEYLLYACRSSSLPGCLLSALAISLD
jgi:hypothetical protein